MNLLSVEELRLFLDENGDWKVVDGAITREWTFPEFGEAVAFVNRVAAMAEDAGHHPDIDIRYNRVRLTLVTHDAGGITAMDTEMARRLGDIAC